MARKESITFTNLDGEEVTEDWYFSLAETDLADLPFMHDANRDEILTNIAKNKDSAGWLKILKMVIFASVGRREDNLLIKDEETVKQFRYGGAYTEFFADLITQEDAGWGFFQSILPERLLKQLQAQEEKTYSKDEMIAMTDEEFEAAFGTDHTKYSPEVLMVAFQRKNHKPAA